MSQSNDTKSLPESKRCPRCGETKPAAEFYVDRRWLSAYCKLCHCAYTNKWVEEHRDRHNELSLASYYRVKARRDQL